MPVRFHWHRKYRLLEQHTHPRYCGQTVATPRLNEHPWQEYDPPQPLFPGSQQLLDVPVKLLKTPSALPLEEAIQEIPA
jgi:hypothetical protein